MLLNEQLPHFNIGEGHALDSNKDDQWISWCWLPMVVPSPKDQNSLTRARGAHEPGWPACKMPVQHAYVQFKRLPMTLRQVRWDCSAQHQGGKA